MLLLPKKLIFGLVKKRRRSFIAFSARGLGGGL
jgi:hypothetical protein